MEKTRYKNEQENPLETKKLALVEQLKNKFENISAYFKSDPEIMRDDLSDLEMQEIQEEKGFTGEFLANMVSSLGSLGKQITETIKPTLPFLASAAMIFATVGEAEAQVFDHAQDVVKKQTGSGFYMRNGGGDLVEKKPGNEQFMINWLDKNQATLEHKGKEYNGGKSIIEHLKEVANNSYRNSIGSHEKALVYNTARFGDKLEITYKKNEEEHVVYEEDKPMLLKYKGNGIGDTYFVTKIAVGENCLNIQPMEAERAIVPPPSKKEIEESKAPVSSCVKELYLQIGCDYANIDWDQPDSGTDKVMMITRTADTIYFPANKIKQKKADGTEEVIMGNWNTDNIDEARDIRQTFLVSKEGKVICNINLTEKKVFNHPELEKVKFAQKDGRIFLSGIDGIPLKNFMLTPIKVDGGELNPIRLDLVEAAQMTIPIQKFRVNKIGEKKRVHGCDDYIEMEKSTAPITNNYYNTENNYDNTQNTQNNNINANGNWGTYPPRTWTPRPIDEPYPPVANPPTRGNTGTTTRVTPPPTRGNTGTTTRVTPPPTRGNTGTTTRVTPPPTRGNTGRGR
jgi:hypothetical protein